MNGFYLSIKTNVPDPIDFIRTEYDELLNGSDPCIHKLHIFSDDKSQYVANGRYRLFNIGTLVYKNTWGKEALEQIAQALEQGRNIKDIAAETRGQFCLVVYVDNEVYVITDRLASFPVYLYRDNSRICIATLFLLMGKKCNVSLNYQAIAEYLSFGYSFLATLFNEISHLQGGTIYRFGVATTTEVYYDYLKDIRFDNFKNVEDIASQFKQTFSDNLSFLKDKDLVFADITGGFDTRLIVTFLKHLGIDFSAGLCGEQECHEAEIASQIAERLSVRFYSSVKINEKELFHRVLEKHLKICNGVPTPYQSTELINYYDEIQRSFDLHIGGFDGSELSSRVMPPLSFISPYLTPRALYVKYFTYINIFKRQFLSRRVYQDEIKSKIERLFERLGSSRHDDAAEYFTLSTMSKNYHGSLLATHNTIMPIYSPYLEVNFVRLMIESSYAAKRKCSIQRYIISQLNKDLSVVMTSRGFNAQYVQGENWHWEFIFKEATRGLLYDSIIGIKLVRFLTGLRKFPTLTFAETQRSFWLDEIKELWCEDLAVFQFLDKALLKRHLASTPNKSILMAKILYVNWLLEQCRPRF